MKRSPEAPQAEIIKRIRLLIAKHSSGNEKAFADMIGVNRNTFGFRMRGETSPTLEEILKIMQVCKVDANWLLTGEETENCLEKLKEARDHIATLKKLVKSLEKQIQ